MLLPPNLFRTILPVLLLCLPYYFFSRWLETKLQPRRSGHRFVGWFFGILLSAGFYFWLVGEVCIRFVFPKLSGI